MSEIDTELGPTCEAVVKANQRITPPTSDEVRHLVLHVGDPAFRFLEGQTIGVVVPGPHAFGNRYHLRRYSVANARQLAAEEGVDVEILVRRCFLCRRRKRRADLAFPQPASDNWWQKTKSAPGKWAANIAGNGKLT